MSTPEGFISLASQLRPDRAGAEVQSVVPEIVIEEYTDEPYAVEEAALLRDVRLFRARIAEAVEELVRELLCDIAAGVLARELQLAPADIAAIVRSALERLAHDEPLRIRAHPEDAAMIDCNIPVLEDVRLAQGDVVFELRNGAMVSALGLRLDTALANVNL